MVHSRGEFYGEVVGWDTHGIRIHVKNTATGKVSLRYFMEVERL